MTTIKNSVRPVTCILGLIAVVSASIILNGCSTATQQRGFLEPSRFAGMLEANEKTIHAGNRGAPTIQTIQLLTGSEEITRDDTQTFQLMISEQPLLVRIHAEVWHQGTDSKPAIGVNGVNVGEMEFGWPSLTQRNYVTFLWDKDKEVGYAYDYQGWLDGTTFLAGEFFSIGNNTISMSIKTDQIKIRNVSAELLYRFDDSDTIYDLRRTSQDKVIPGWRGKK